MAKKVARKSINPTGRAWVIARKIVQYLALALFLLFFLFTKKDGWPGNVVNLPMRLDPLTALAHLLASRTFLAGSALALLTVGLTLVFGRAWCGWLCPLGTTLDLFSLKKIRGDRKPPSERWRVAKYLLLVAILTAALLGNLSLLAFDPLTILIRTLTTSVWPAIDRVVLFLERMLFQVPALRGAVGAFDAAVRPALLPTAQAFFKDGLLFATLFAAIVALNALAERFWCRYLCPLGGLLGWISKLAFVRRRVGEECPGCVLCTDACPTGTIDPARNYASDPAECTMCLDCLETCPRTRVGFPAGLPQPERQPYDPGRREALLTIGATAAAIVVGNTGLLAKREPAHLIRPPGAREVNPDVGAMTKCIRCSECMRVCPTSALQPAVFETGLEGLGAPLLIPRLGYCDFSCNACGQVCPSQAIPLLSLEEKRLRVIGRAYIDESRCIPWSDHIDCIVCEEMCPLPDKAIQLEEREVWGRDGVPVMVKLPHVLRDVCIGCGICEYKCPLNGEAAIRVYVPEAPVPF